MATSINSSRPLGYKVLNTDWNELAAAINSESAALDVVEARTTDGTTGNSALGARTTTVENKLGSGVGTTTDVTTGTATAQLGNLRSRVSGLEASPIANGPRGVIARGFRTTDKTGITAAATGGIFRLDNVTLTAGRLYRVSVGPFGGTGAANGTAQFAIRFATGAAVATTADSKMVQGNTECKIVNGGGTGFASDGFAGWVAVASTTTYSFLFCLSGGSAFGTVNLYSTEYTGVTCAMFVEDIGPAVTATGTSI